MLKRRPVFILPCLKFYTWAEKLNSVRISTQSFGKTRKFERETNPNSLHHNVVDDQYSNAKCILVISQQNAMIKINPCIHQQNKNPLTETNESGALQLSF